MNKLNEIVSTQKWEALQDSFTEVTQLSLVCVNHDGTPVSKHSGCHEFCAKVRKNPEWSRYCRKCDARGGFEALRIGKPYIYKCFLGIIDIAIPIVIDHQYIGALMAGQVCIASDDASDIENIIQLPHQETINRIHQELSRDYASLPIMNLKQIETAATALASLCDFISHERSSSFLRNKKITSALPAYQDNLSSNVSIPPTIQPTTQELIIKKTNGKYPYLSHVLKLALEYIFSDKHFYPTLSETADHCHITPSYLSRLFSKELGEGYNNLITRIKIDDAKVLLKENYVSINKISEILNYEDTGYFIKIFKKNTGLTPLNYRKALLNSIVF
ncbi:MAG: PocR ligand-binding domain-containing protein [Lachnospiraceae bacterium]|nr:PocR ligand-binding domain-containing protein [Lachnospiraceae bacterium]